MTGSPGGAENHPTTIDGTSHTPRWGAAYTPSMTVTAGELTRIENNPNCIPEILRDNPGLTRQDIAHQMGKSQFGSSA